MAKKQKEIPQKFGRLITPDIKIYRDYFDEMTSLIGINVKVRIPRETSKTYTDQGELETLYKDPIIVGAIFDEHPDQKTLKKAGWVVELDDSAAVIYLPFDLEGLQAGTLIDVPSAIEGADDRTFRVTEMSNIMIYPASIACTLAPEYISTLPLSQTTDFKGSNVNVIVEETEW